LVSHPFKIFYPKKTNEMKYSILISTIFLILNNGFTQIQIGQQLDTLVNINNASVCLSSCGSRVVIFSRLANTIEVLEESNGNWTQVGKPFPLPPTSSINKGFLAISVDGKRVVLSRTWTAPGTVDRNLIFGLN